MDGGGNGSDTGNDTVAGAAEARVREMCEKLLANTVIENYRVEIDS